MRLYRVLPFYPARGEETVGGDIDNIVQNHMRHNVEEQAKQALARWRRMHTRDKVEDLTNALLEIRRKDIVDKIQMVLSVKSSSSFVDTVFVRTVHFPKLPVK